METVAAAHFALAGIGLCDVLTSKWHIRSLFHLTEVATLVGSKEEEKRKQIIRDIDMLINSITSSQLGLVTTVLLVFTHANWMKWCGVGILVATTLLHRFLGGIESAKYHTLQVPGLGLRIHTLHGLVILLLNVAIGIIHLLDVAHAATPPG